MDPRNIRKPAPEAVSVTAPSLEEAYRLVKSRFGGDAVILETRGVTVPGSRGLGTSRAIELIVARGDSGSRPSEVDAPDLGELVERLESEIACLEDRVADLASLRTAESPVTTGDADDLADGLARLGATEGTARTLATRFRIEADADADFSDWLAGQLECADCTWEGVEGLHAFVGPSGSGRTRLTLAAAARVAATGRRALVLTVAPEHPGEIRRLQHAASEGDFDAAVIRRPEQVVELATSLADYAAVFVDLPALESPAMVPGSDLHEWLAAHHGIHRHLLVPLDLDPADMDELTVLARNLNCDWIAAGRLDRTRRPAKLLDLVAAVPLRLSLLAGFEPARIATRESLAELLRLGADGASRRTVSAEGEAGS